MIDKLSEVLEWAKGLEAKIRELEGLVMYDPLTHALNRRGLNDVWAKEKARMDRNKTCMSLVYLDLDNFKGINDMLGHDAGDRVLVEFSEIVSHAIRPGDAYVRLGGEEFLILFPDTNLREATNVVDRIRDLTGKLDDPPVTFSSGITEVRPIDNLSYACKRADEAMYLAKRSGKNRTCIGE